MSDRAERRSELLVLECPTCKSHLSMKADGKERVFRCAQSHVFTSHDLFALQSGELKESLEKALQILEQRVVLLNDMATMMRRDRQPELAEEYVRNAQDCEQRAQMLRDAIKKSPPCGI